MPAGLQPPQGLAPDLLRVVARHPGEGGVGRQHLAGGVGDGDGLAAVDEDLFRQQELVVLALDDGGAAGHAQHQHLQKGGEQQPHHPHRPGQPGPVGLTVVIVGAHRQEPVAIAHAQVGAPVHRGRRGGGGAGNPLPEAVEQGLLRLGLDIDEVEAQPRRDPAAGGDVDHLVDLDHADGEALVAGWRHISLLGVVLSPGFGLGLVQGPDPRLAPGQGLSLATSLNPGLASSLNPGLVTTLALGLTPRLDPNRVRGRRRCLDGQELQQADPLLTLLHQQDGGGHRHGVGRPGALDGPAPDGLGVDVITHRRLVARQGHDIANGDVLGPGRRPDQPPLGVALGDLEGPQGGEGADPRLEGRALGVGDQVVVTQGEDIRVVLQGAAGEALELGEAEVRGGLDEVTQGGEDLAVGDEAVGDPLGDEVTVVPQGVGLGLGLPARGPPEGQDRQGQGQDHGQDGAPEPFAPQGVTAVEEAEGQGGEDQHAQDVPDVPVPPGIGGAGGGDDARQGQGADAKGGRNQAGDHPTQEQETEGILLQLQGAPGVTLPAPDQPGPGTGLQAGADPDRQGDDQGGGAQGPAEPGMAQVEQTGTEPDTGQDPGAELEPGRQGQTRRGKDRTGVTGRDGQEQAGGAQQQIGQAEEEDQTHRETNRGLSGAKTSGGMSRADRFIRVNGRVLGKA